MSRSFDQRLTSNSIRLLQRYAPVTKASEVGQWLHSPRGSMRRSQFPRYDCFFFCNAAARAFARKRNWTNTDRPPCVHVRELESWFLNNRRSQSLSPVRLLRKHVDAFAVRTNRRYVYRERSFVSRGQAHPVFSHRSATIIQGTIRETICSVSQETVISSLSNVRLECQYLNVTLTLCQKHAFPVPKMLNGDRRLDSFPFLRARSLIGNCAAAKIYCAGRTRFKIQLSPRQTLRSIFFIANVH